MAGQDQGSCQTGMMDKALNIPPAWERLDFSRLGGILMVLGAPDVGKSTFAQYLYRRICASSAYVAYLDGDPGQSILGPPATLTLALNARGDASFPPQGRIWRSFVGSVSPRGHMLPMLTGAFRLTTAAREDGAQAIIHDTSGFVSPVGGGSNLKLAKIEVLRPTLIFAIQREQELERLLIPLRRSHRVQVIELSSSPAARRRDPATRRGYRTNQFANYFTNSQLLRMNWPRFAIFPGPFFELGHLVALENAAGFTVGLGIVREIDRESKQIEIQTPLTSTNEVDAIRLGNLALDPQTFEGRHLNHGAVPGWT
ncbi:MAG: hypothetical protein HY882_11295 [Deltaproteobacteria bacterium]|nr:hypothetical protein [Deltaproteobacteria bacterium]